MITFLPPTLDDESGVTLVSVSAEADLTVTEAEIKTLRSAVDLEEEDHFIYRTNIGEEGSVVGLVGIHDYGIADETEVDPTAHIRVHFSIGYRAGLTFRAEKATPGWSEALDLINEHLSERLIEVEAFLRVDEGAERFAFPVPMDLAETGIAGFTELRGARLVKSDPEEPEKELYSVILDSFGGTSPANVSVSAWIEAGVDENLLPNALQRCSSVLELALD